MSFDRSTRYTVKGNSDAARKGNGCYVKGMPRFTIKDLFLTTTLIAIGLALLYIFLVRGPQPLPFAVTLFFWLCVGPLIGSGLGLLFQKMKIGAVIGLAAYIVVWFLFLCLGWL